MDRATVSFTTAAPATMPATAAAATTAGRRSRRARETAMAGAGKLCTDAGLRSGGAAGTWSGPPTTSTGTSRRYPRRGSVSTYRGVAAWSPRAAADLADAEVQRLLEIDERPFRPDLALDLLARDELAGTAHQEGEDTRRLRLEPGTHPGFPELSAPRVELEDAEAEPPAALSLHPQQVWLSSHWPPLAFRLLVPLGDAPCVPRNDHSPHPHPRL